MNLTDSTSIPISTITDRACLFPKSFVDKKGEQRKRYPYDAIMTPYDKLKPLPQAQNYLKPSVTFEILDMIAYKLSDNDVADTLQKSKQKLFNLIHGQYLNQAEYFFLSDFFFRLIFGLENTLSHNRLFIAEQASHL